MICSMTGYASATRELESGSLSLELRSVNSRYLELQLRIPDELRTQEPALREAISARISRGKVECRISFTPPPIAQTATQPNLDVVRKLAHWSALVRRILPDARELSVAEVLGWKGVLESPPDSNEPLQTAVLTLLQQVLTEFHAFRQREGERLKSFLLERLAAIETLRASVAPRIPEAIATCETRLRARLSEAMDSGENERIRQEIMLYINRIDVDEELSRLQAHLLETRRTLDKGGPVGKRLDFLMQELNREANTLGAKAADHEISHTALEIKVLVEQMREQIQNIE